MLITHNFKNNKFLTMKNIIYVILLQIPIFSFAQSAIEYTYDNAGNRIQKKIQVNLLPPSEGEAFARNINLGANLNDLDIEMSVFPNPTQDELQVVFQQPLENAEIKLFNLSGKLLLSTPISATNMSISINAYPAGEYVLIIQDGQRLKQWKVVKMK